ncbi:MAG TPA: hypothetical protein DEQ61_25930 [Streptomyces sp.]|nr:hypothetical protein [Streptomyces sp.]
MNESPAPAGPTARRRKLAFTASAIALGVALFVAGAIGLSPPDTTTPAAPAGDSGPRPGERAESRISGLQKRLKRLPEDHASWAEIGLEYVQEAQRTADPQYYPKAEKALRRSMKLQAEENHLAQLGLGALAAARHEFTAALDWAHRAVATNPHNAGSYGVLTDAYLQLGRYEESFEATQKMVDLQPATPSLARVSYAWELRGDLDRARKLMRRALNAAGSRGDSTFARYHLALLALNDGDPEAALREARTGLRAAPGDPTLLEARARAQAALGHESQAVKDYEAAIARVPQPSYVLALGDLHQSQGHTKRAEARYALYRDQVRLFEAAGVAADAETVLFETDHGSPRRAVELAREAVRERPFLATQDAYAWALHRAGRDNEALTRSDRALQLGTRSALFHFHRGMIHDALGEDAAARRDLTRALEIDPRFHPLHAPDARAALDRIGPA